MVIEHGQRRMEISVCKNGYMIRHDREDKTTHPRTVHETLQSVFDTIEEYLAKPEE